MFRMITNLIIYLFFISAAFIMSGCNTSSNSTKSILPASMIASATDASEMISDTNSISAQTFAEDTENTIVNNQTEMMWGIASYNVQNVYEWDSSLSAEERINRLIADFDQVNAGWFRPNFIWNDIEPELKRASMIRDEISNEMITRYAFPENYSDWESYPHFYEPDWSFYDLLVNSLYESGINIFPVICNGDSKQMPLYNGKSIYPGSSDINKESYIAHAKLHAAGVALRYQDKIEYYQAENELNCAGLQVFPWLSREGYAAWNDWEFQTDLLATIADAIRLGDDNALISTNFVVIACDWHSMVEDWTSGENADILDIVGVDVYSNYLYGWAVDTHSVGGCVEEAYLFSNGKPVIVSETGYPTNPWYLGFSENKQAKYVRENMEDAWYYEAIGFFYYRLVTKESWVRGGFPQESYWGFVRKNNTYKPATAEFSNKALEHPYVK